MRHEFVGAIKDLVENMQGNMHTAIAGTITSFDPGSCTANAKPAGQFITGSGNAIPYPIVTQAPVVMPFSTSSNCGIAFPCKAGDGCIIIFSENELDEWRTGAESECTMRFDLSSAMVVPCLLKKGSAAVQKASSNGSVVVSSGSTELEVSKSRVTIKGNLHVDGNISCTGSHP